VLRNLIDTESRAVLIQDLSLITDIFHADAVRIDSAKNETGNAIQWYQKNFDPNNPDRIVFSSAVHLNYQISLAGNTAVVTNDSCGSFTQNGAKIDYTSIQSDRWTFTRDAQGRWWIMEMAINQPFPGPQMTFAFEEPSDACPPAWAVRYVDTHPQGQPPEIVQGTGLEGTGALQLAFDTAANPNRRGQVVAYNIPFGGTASAYVYLPPEVSASLEAGFFAQELDQPPWRLHEPNQYFPLKSGEWTPITWDIPIQGWKNDPLHLLGIEIRAKTGDYNGYVLIDEIKIETR
jgi:hypothetical protein